MTTQVDPNRADNPYFTRSKRISFGREGGTPLPDNTFHFAVTNDGEEYGFMIDGVIVGPKDMADFTLMGWNVKPKPRLTLTQRLMRALRRHR